MMSQEEFMDVLELHRRGWTIEQIAVEVGRHPQTVSKWLRAGGPPERRAPVADAVIDERWQRRIGELLEKNRQLKATSIVRLLEPEGFDVGYSTLTRYLRQLRGPRRPSASAVTSRIETAPGEEAQLDFSPLKSVALRWGLPASTTCFGAILCWSRRRFWWFTDSEDRAHTLEGFVRFFEAVDGIPAICRVDNMGALFRHPAPRAVLHAPVLDFVRHHGVAIRPCLPGDAKRKGKVERPFRDLKELLIAELEASPDGPPATIAELQVRSDAWLERHWHHRPHRTTGEPPWARWEREQPLLAPLPRRRFDTARTEVRVVSSRALVELDRSFYSVPHTLVGQRVRIRIAVDSTSLEIHAAEGIVATHQLADVPGTIQWDRTHREAIDRELTARHHPALQVIDGERPDHAPPPQQVALPDGDFDVAPIDLAGRYQLDPQEGA
jgi:transposase